MREMKVMPLPSDVPFATHIGIIRRMYRKNSQGNNCDYSLVFLKNGELVNCKEIGSMNEAVFHLCRYVWCTSQPLQTVIQDTKLEEPEDRWEAVAEDV